ncbi:uncharacterized protein EKO05_0008896 [Ascochyta rabiei]|uniref:Uncharacterized protein n=1 Tax=Didymella rabiei TaxID=5454 RepID=A0A163ASA0_DIDRA|nr:uncharacterized protein EKO05_0008896 [Ascochyta rabiei]KZM21354.1 hypothetical protein ST47_g7527 [Ascochyta rabiei]UPX18602.1 hypothetical protein EKO05_0008896 [Ascochyta rabiei]
MKFLIVAAALAIPALAMPQPASEGSALGVRDNVKFNQYRNFEDCRNDNAILFHAAPVSGRCINIDSQTGAFFVNTAGFLASKLYSGGDCNGNTLGVSGGSCIERGQWNSFKLV